MLRANRVCICFDTVTPNVASVVGALPMLLAHLKEKNLYVKKRTYLKVRTRFYIHSILGRYRNHIRMVHNHTCAVARSQQTDVVVSVNVQCHYQPVVIA